MTIAESGGSVLGEISKHTVKYKVQRSRTRKPFSDETRQMSKKKDKMHTVEIKLSHIASLDQHTFANCVEMTDGSSWYHRTRMNTS